MKYTNLKSLFDAIADAIRGKDDSTAGIVADDFPERIAAIETSNTDVEDALLTGSGLKSYTNNRITTLRQYAFSGSDVETVTLGSVTTFQENSFYFCTKLQKVTGATVEQIAENAFGLCPSFEHLDIYGGVGVDNYMLGAGSGLRSFIIRNPTKVTVLFNHSYGEGMSNVLQNSSCYIYVPASMVDAYKAHEMWGLYASRIRAIEDYPEITGG